MKKELRVYMLKIDLMSMEELTSQPIYTADDDAFITLCETHGCIYSLKGFEEEVNLGRLECFSDVYIRFIEVEVYDLNHELFDYSAE